MNKQQEMKSLKTILKKTGTLMRKSFLTLLMIAPVIAFAQEEVKEPAKGFFDQVNIDDASLFYFLLAITLFLLIAIWVLAAGIKNALEGELNRKEESKKGSGVGMKVITVLIGTMFFFSSNNTFAADTGESILKLSQSAIISIVILDIILLFIVIYLFIVSNVIARNIREGSSAEFQRKGVFRIFTENLTGAVPIEQERNVLMDHEYDGIRELDNNLPPWWKYGFYLTILIGAIYFSHYHIFRTGDLQAEEYEKAMIEASKGVKAIEVTLIENAARLANAEKVFIEKCAVCHGNKGQGVVGPNLTDDYWMYGGSLNDIYKIIDEGAVEKGMAAWGKTLSNSELQELTSFIKNLRGTNPPNGKSKQGELYEGE